MRARFLVAVLLSAALAVSGCAEPLSFVPVPAKRAVTTANKKGTGTAELQAIRGDKLVREQPVGFVFPPLHSTLAQSGEGLLGDRLFRLDQYGLLEGCRWAAKGRVCDLVALPDGTFLGGNMHWIVPTSAAATPRASGWVAQGTFLAAAASGEDANATYRFAPVLLGRAYHCRFADVGPRCLLIPATSTALGFTVLGSFSLRDGTVQREVLWVGLLPEGDVTALATFTGKLEIRELHRCETTEEATEVTCKLVSFK